eukprot:GHVO01021277.1.p1 GENE.GHVO01021277.1~~GHVO01021277.1.p1  ORF type:complete len:439 (-),score=45.28 GHVO01021277.1:154-1470(-)
MLGQMPFVSYSRTRLNRILVNSAISYSSLNVQVGVSGVCLLFASLKCAVILSQFGTGQLQYVFKRIKWSLFAVCCFALIVTGVLWLLGPLAMLGSSPSFQNYGFALVSTLLMFQPIMYLKFIEVATGNVLGQIFELFAVYLLWSTFQMILGCIYCGLENLGKDSVTDLSSKLRTSGLSARSPIVIRATSKALLHWRAFVKALEFARRHEESDSAVPQIAGYKDEIFAELKRNPIFESNPQRNKHETTKKKAIVSHKALRIQQYLTDIEIMRAKKFLISSELQIINSILSRRKQHAAKLADYIISAERNLGEINADVEDLKNAVYFLEMDLKEPQPEYHRRQDPAVAKTSEEFLKGYVEDESRMKRAEEWRNEVAEGRIAPKKHGGDRTHVPRPQVAHRDLPFDSAMAPISPRRLQSAGKGGASDSDEEWSRARKHVPK